MKKRNEQLLDALSDVGMDLVEESEIRSSFGNGWRRFGSLAACLVLVAGMTAAGLHFLPRLVSNTPDPQPNLTDTPDPGPAPDVHVPTPPIADDNEGPAIPENPGEIRYLYNEQGSYTDGVDNYSLYRYVVPQLNFAGAKAINDDIAARFGKAVEEQLQAMKEGVSLHTTDVGFKDYRNGDILTLVCWENTAYDYSVYAAYHFNTATGTEVDNEALLQAVGIAPEDYLAALKQTAASRYLHNAMLWGNYASGQLFEADFRWEQYKKTVSDHNLNLDVPMYVTETDSGPVVRAFPNIYSIAGANYYPEEVSVLGETSDWNASAGDLKLDYRTELGDAWTGTMDLTLYWTDPERPDLCGAYETVELHKGWYLDRICVLMDGYTWTEYPGYLPPEPGNFWLNLSGNGINWTFWDDGDAGFLLMQKDNDLPVCWKADYVRSNATMPIDEEFSVDANAGYSVADGMLSLYDDIAAADGATRFYLIGQEKNQSPVQPIGTLAGHKTYTAIIEGSTAYVLVNTSSTQTWYLSAGLYTSDCLYLGQAVDGKSVYLVAEQATDLNIIADIQFIELDGRELFYLSDESGASGLISADLAENCTIWVLDYNEKGESSKITSYTSADKFSREVIDDTRYTFAHVWIENNSNSQITAIYVQRTPA